MAAMSFVVRPARNATNCGDDSRAAAAASVSGATVSVPAHAPGREQPEAQPTEVHHRRERVASEREDADAVDQLGVRGMEGGFEARKGENERRDTTGLDVASREGEVIVERVVAQHARPQRTERSRQPRRDRDEQDQQISTAFGRRLVRVVVATPGGRRRQPPHDEACDQRGQDQGQPAELTDGSDDLRERDEQRDAEDRGREHTKCPRPIRKEVGSQPARGEPYGTDDRDERPDADEIALDAHPRDPADVPVSCLGAAVAPAARHRRRSTRRGQQGCTEGRPISMMRSGVGENRLR